MYILKQTLCVSVLLVGFLIGPVLAADKVAGEQKAANCVGCHGSKGKSSSGQWPNLAAQPASYLINQLNAFKSGVRSNPVMQAMATSLSDDDIKNLAAYYASLSPVSAGGDVDLAKLGQNKATMCLGCHGSSAEGNGQFPRLAGQQPDYLLAQLNAFKTGERKSGPMQAFVGSISEADMKALAAYFGTIK